MKWTSIPEPRVVFEEIGPLVPHLYAALENGTMKAREYFELEKQVINRYLAPEIVRYHAKMYLDAVSKGLFSTEPLARNGLWIKGFGDVEIRVFKSFDGELPIPGSKARQEYYEQLTLPIFPKEPLKLAVLWNVGHPYDLQLLKLACPRTSDPEKMLVEAHWYAPIPYPTRKTFEVPPSEEHSVDKLIKPKRKKPDTGTHDESKK